MTHRYRPLHNLVQVRRVRNDELQGRLHVPEDALNRDNRWEIVALGPKCESLTEADIGGVCVVARHAGEEVQPPDAGWEFAMFVSEDRIISIIEEVLEEPH